MKKHICFTMLLSLFGILGAIGQNIPTYTIPSYDVEVCGYANFSNGITGSDTTGYDEKKWEAHISLNAATPETPGCQATVWLYTVDQSTILGPYELLCGNTLVVEIDERDWGVLVESESEVIVDVWIE